jgi:hypothetical protein
LPTRFTKLAKVGEKQFERRGLWAVGNVHDLLQEVKLNTKPDFGVVYIDSEVEPIPAEKAVESVIGDGTSVVDVQQNGGNGSGAPLMTAAQRVQHVSDLAFGEYIRSLDIAGNWCQLGLDLVNRACGLRNARADS